MRLLLSFLDAAFPYTSARLHHWLYVFSNANVNTLDHHSLRPPVLPLYLFVLETVVELYLEMMHPWDQNPPAWPFLGCALLVHQALDILSALGVVITTPGFLAKLMVALDLSFDLLLTYTAKLASIAISLTVVAAVVQEIQ